MPSHFIKYFLPYIALLASSSILFGQCVELKKSHPTCENNDGKIEIKFSAGVPDSIRDSITWLRNDTLMEGFRDTLANKLPAGKYTIRIKGCDTLELTLEKADSIPFVLKTITNTCPEAPAGRIEISLKGNSKIKVSWKDQANLVDTSRARLPAASYTLQLRWGICALDSVLEVKSLDVPTLSFQESPSTSYLPGETVSITALGSFAAVEWENPAQKGARIEFVASTSTQLTAVATSKDGCKVSKTIPITVRSTPQLFMPNAFSPNGNGVDDTFGPVFKEQASGDRNKIEILYFKIFNRNGQTVFEKNGGADVRWDGGDQPAGVYLYQLGYKDFNGMTKHIKEKVFLIR